MSFDNWVWRVGPGGPGGPGGPLGPVALDVVKVAFYIGKEKRCDCDIDLVWEILCFLSHYSFIHLA